MVKLHDIIKNNYSFLDCKDVNKDDILGKPLIILETTPVWLKNGKKEIVLLKAKAYDLELKQKISFMCSKIMTMNLANALKILGFRWHSEHAKFKDGIEVTIKFKESKTGNKYYYLE